MKICFLVGSDKPVPAVEGGAVEMLVQNILDEYEKDSETNLEISVLTAYNEKAPYAKYQKTRFYFIPPFFDSAIGIYWKIVAFFKVVLHIQLLAPLPKVYERHFLKKHFGEYDYFIEETNLDAIEEKYADKILYHLHYAGNPVSSEDRKIGHLIAISRFIGRSWQKGTGRTENTIHILKNCIDLSQYEHPVSEAKREEICQKWNLSKADKAILFVGRIVEEKGVLELIEAFARIADDHTVLLMLGSANFGRKSNTAYERRVRDVIQKSGKRIIHVGFVPNAELSTYQSVAAMQVIPSIWQEPAGLVVLEAQAAGLPVIASKVGGIPEFLSEEAGVLVDVNENFVDALACAMRDLLADPQKLQQMGMAGRNFVRQYNTQNYYREFKKILEQIQESDGAKNG